MKLLHAFIVGFIATALAVPMPMYNPEQEPHPYITYLPLSWRCEGFLGIMQKYWIVVAIVMGALRVGNYWTRNETPSNFNSVFLLTPITLAVIYSCVRTLGSSLELSRERSQVALSMYRTTVSFPQCPSFVTMKHYIQHINEVLQIIDVTPGKPAPPSRSLLPGL
jgi:hypothetical protein